MSDEAKSPSPSPQGIYLISYPKVVFLYPSFLMALLAGLYFTFVGDEGQVGVAVSTIFLGILGLNLIVLSFDFPRTTSLTLLFLTAALVLGAVLLIRTHPDILPAVGEILRKLQPTANAHFYFLFAAILGLIYVAVVINVQFDYWEVRPNELLHHHGMLSNLERFPAPRLRIDKEINDVFEYLLLRSGRLILQASSERKAIVLENVFFINRKESQLTRMLGALQVQLRTDQE